MKVNDAIERLLELPLEADLLICGHEFPADIEGWHITNISATDDNQWVMLCGAHPLDNPPGVNAVVPE